MKQSNKSDSQKQGSTPKLLHLCISKAVVQKSNIQNIQTSEKPIEPLKLVAIQYPVPFEKPL
jgi:hypothetical protein